MREQGGGSIVNVSSVAGLNYIPDLMAYGMAKAALEILNSDASIELVVTDQVMPQMTGLQLAKIVAQTWPDVLVVIATGYAETEPGALDNMPKLAKPFTRQELAAEILRLLPLTRNAGRVVRFPRAEAMDK